MRPQVNWGRSNWQKPLRRLPGVMADMPKLLPVKPCRKVFLASPGLARAVPERRIWPYYAGKAMRMAR